MPSTTNYKPGDVVIVRFPFSDLTSSKKRPAVVLSPPEFSAYGDIVLLALTSVRQADNLRIKEWRQSGLLKPTWFKPILATLSATVLLSRLGELSAADQRTVASVLKKMISPKFAIREARKT
jgi:mRNA interferase MazF